MAVTSRKAQAEKPEAQASAAAQEGEGEEEEVDIDLNDPEVAAAASKIQAGFKGHKARQEVKKMREVSSATFRSIAIPWINLALLVLN